MPAREQGWRVIDPACFSRWPGSFASYDPESSSWRTFQRSILGGWVPYSGRWPLSGMLRGGEVCEHQRWAHLIDVSGGSVSLGWPTPTKNSGGDRKHCGISGTTLSGAAERVKAWPTPDAGVFNYAESPESWDKRKQRHPNNGPVLSVEVKRGTTGRLNPAWVEGLMGFPAGWSLTDGPPLRDHSTPTNHRAPDHERSTTATD